MQAGKWQVVGLHVCTVAGGGGGGGVGEQTTQLPEDLDNQFLKVPVWFRDNSTLKPELSPSLQTLETATFLMIDWLIDLEIWEITQITQILTIDDDQRIGNRGKQGVDLIWLFSQSPFGQVAESLMSMFYLPDSKNILVRNGKSLFVLWWVTQMTTNEPAGGSGRPADDRMKGSYADKKVPSFP